MGGRFPKIIGIAAVVAAATGYLPIPGLPGSVPSEDAAGATPPPPAVADVETGEPVGPDDGLIRVIVTPTAPAPGLAPEIEAEADPTPDLVPSGVAPAYSAANPGAIDPAALAGLSAGATLVIDEQGRPVAEWPNADRIPLYSTAASRPAAPTVPLAGNLDDPIKDSIAQLEGVVGVVAIGDGSYSVTLEDPDVLDDLPLTQIEDAPMGIFAEPYEPYQWALDNTGDNLSTVTSSPPAQTPDADIDGVEAWTGATGRNIVVAVIDSGVDFSHPDLAPAKWINNDEICDNGRDDDANGYVDDCEGWDFAYEDPTPFNPGAHPHGTHVAGIVAAAINGSGVAGVAPDAKIMNLNVGTITSSGQPGITTSAVARAIRYAVDNGAHVINLSLGTPPGSPRAGSVNVESAIAYAETRGVLVVVAAGNDGTDLDTAPSWPASYEMSNMLTVGASSPTDQRASFSNWGAVVDVFAPGEMILSAVPAVNGNFRFMSGTSQAAPIVAASAALILEGYPALSPAEVRIRLTDGADRTDALAAYVTGGVRLNSANALGLSTPRYDIAEIAVKVTGLAGATEGSPIQAELEIAVPDEHFEDSYQWTASLFTTTSAGVHAVVGHAITIGGSSAKTSTEGTVDLGLNGSGRVRLSTALPAGSYALVLEAVPDDDRTTRLGDPLVASFAVAGSPATSPEDTPTARDPVATDDPATDDTTSSGPAPDSTLEAPPDSTEPVFSPGSPDSAPPDAGTVGSATTEPAPSEEPAPIEDASAEPTNPLPTGTSGDTGGATATGGSTDTGSTSDTAGSTGGSTDRGGNTSAGGTAPTDPAPEPPAATTNGDWAITSVMPHYGPVDLSTLVVLIGSFPKPVHVWFGDTPGVLLYQSDDIIYVFSPALSQPAEVDVSLRRTGLGTVLSVSNGYTYVSSDPTEGSTSTGGSTDSSGGSTSTGRTTDTAGTGGSTDTGGSTGRTTDTDGSADTGPTSIRQTRATFASTTTDLGNGLAGALVLAGDPTVGAVTCSSEPCVLR